MKTSYGRREVLKQIGRAGLGLATLGLIDWLPSQLAAADAGWLIGDVDGDGRVSLIDAILALKMSVDLLPLEPAAMVGEQAMASPGLILQLALGLPLPVTTLSVVDEQTSRLFGQFGFVQYSPRLTVGQVIAIINGHRQISYEAPLMAPNRIGQPNGSQAAEPMLKSLTLPKLGDVGRGYDLVYTVNSQRRDGNNDSLATTIVQPGSAVTILRRTTAAPPLFPP